MSNKKSFLFYDGESIEINLYSTQIDKKFNNVKHFIKSLNQNKKTSNKFVAGMDSIYATEYQNLKKDMLFFLKKCSEKKLNIYPDNIIAIFQITEAKFSDIIFDLLDDGLLKQTDKGLEIKGLDYE